MSNTEPQPAACPCERAPQPADQYDTYRAVGSDPTNGRYGMVTILHCHTCGQLWLHYQVEYEGFSRSGRFFMGPISADLADEITPCAAIPWLGSLPWYLFGGSYFDGHQGRTSLPLYADL
jgi:hypothetical protein